MSKAIVKNNRTCFYKITYPYKYNKIGAITNITAPI